MSAVFLAFGHCSEWARSLLKRKLIPVRVKRKRNRFDAAGSPPFMLTIPETVQVPFAAWRTRSGLVLSLCYSRWR